MDRYPSTNLEANKERKVDEEYLVESIVQGHPFLAGFN